MSFIQSFHILAFSMCVPTLSWAQTPCVAGMAGSYPCHKVDLMAHIDLASLNAGNNANDCWGWTDPVNGREYALVGLFTGTAFVDITEPTDPVLIGNLPTHSGNSLWRDIKVYADHAYIVSEASGHGMQVFDLTRLDTVSVPPVTFTEDAHYVIFSNAHNLAIDEESGMAYVVGSNQCGGALFMLDLATPTSPSLVGCYDLDGYIHDTQCVVYQGPDATYQGRRICFNSHSGVDKLSIVDVTDPSDPEPVSVALYPMSSIGHQGWLSEDHRYFFMGDEGDEQGYGINTRTLVFDVSDLDLPVLVGSHLGSTPSIDHNRYTHLGLIFHGNYRAGLRVMDIVDAATADLDEVAWFDTYPASDAPDYTGAWSVFPYFSSGNVIISDYSTGLYVVRPTERLLRVRVFLQGPYDSEVGTMRDDLRVQHLVPLTEPYTALGYPHVADGGGETTTADMLNVTGADAIVDWVVLELRSGSEPSVVISTRSALLQRDGDVVDPIDGEAVRFTVPMGRYHVAVRHRNHLGVMSAATLPVGPSNTRHDLSDGSIALYGTEPVVDQDGTLLLWAGNVTMDAKVKYTGSNNDRDPILVRIGAIPTAVEPGYHPEDVNLSGEVKYTGDENDRDPILVNIGGSIPTNTRQEQLP